MLRATLWYRGVPRDYAKEFRAELTEALLALGEYWHDRFAPKHFTIAGEKEYDYYPRHPSYSRYKAKRFGHRRPLVLTGDLERMVLGVARVSATSQSASVVMRGPKYLYAYRKDLPGGRPSQGDKAAELTAVTPAELNELAGVFERHLADALARLNVTETRSFQ
jgi:hypothetical protein